MKTNHKHQTALQLFTVLLTVLLLVSCRERNLYEGGPENELDIENLFDFSTAQSVTLDVKYDVADQTQLNVEVYTQDPLMVGPLGDKVRNTEINPAFAGQTKKGGQLSCTVNIPAAAQKLYLYSPNLVAPTLVVGDIVNGKVTIANATEYEDAPAPMSASTRASTSGSYYKNWNTRPVVAGRQLGTWDTKGKPNYLLTERRVFTSEFNSKLDDLLPKDDNMEATSFLYKTMTLKEDANVDMYFVSHAFPQRHNALAYYSLAPGEAHPDQLNTDKSLTIVFPDLASTSLQQGDGVRLKYKDGSELFPAGSTIGWVLLVDAYKNNTLESPCNLFYSWSGWNGYDFTVGPTVMRNRPHMGAFRLGDDIVLSFEDQPWGKGKPANYRDDVFVLNANPPTSFPGDIIDPDDPAKNSATQEGIYLFEDNWPATGDYDLNDVMVKYKSTYFFDNENRIFSFEHTYTFVHERSGATYQSAFGLQMGELVTRDNIESCTFDDGVDFSGRGLDLDLDVATFMVFNDGRSSVGKTVTMKIKLKKPISVLDFVPLPFLNKPLPYNPFIVVKGLNETDRTEVHLRNFKPTAKANMSLFGTDGDLSKPAENLYYVSNDNHPFALDVLTTDAFRIPVEAKPIEYTYPQFTNWATTQGKENLDWYKHPVKE